MDNTYEYTGLMAQTWDLFRGDTSGWPDRVFYRNIIQREGQPVLDVGCGTGRLILDYLAAGIDIDGVDNSPEMLDLCRSKAAEQGLTPRLYEQEMETLALPRTYRTILVPSSSLQLICDPAKADRAMECLVAHLEPNGVLVASFMTFGEAGEPGEHASEKSAVRPSDSATIRYVSLARYDPATECASTEDLYQVVRDGVVIAEEKHHRSPATRSYTQEQARTLFERSGLVDVMLYQGFSDTPAQPGDALFTALGRRTKG